MPNCCIAGDATDALEGPKLPYLKGDEKNSYIKNGFDFQQIYKYRALALSVNELATG